MNINDNNLLDDLFVIFCKSYNIRSNDIEKYYTKKNHKSKNQMKLEMMVEKNELFELLTLFDVMPSILSELKLIPLILVFSVFSLGKSLSLLVN